MKERRHELRWSVKMERNFYVNRRCTLFDVPEDLCILVGKKNKLLDAKYKTLFLFIYPLSFHKKSFPYFINKNVTHLSCSNHDLLRKTLYAGRNLPHPQPKEVPK